MDEQEKYESERSERWRACTGGCEVRSCGVWLSYSLPVAFVGWAVTSRETNLGKKVAEITLSA